MLHTLQFPVHLYHVLFNTLLQEWKFIILPSKLFSMLRNLEWKFLDFSDSKPHEFTQSSANLCLKRWFWGANFIFYFLKSSKGALREWFQNSCWSIPVIRPLLTNNKFDMEHQLEKFILFMNQISSPMSQSIQLKEVRE